jgi:hypothetical protein
MALAHVQFDVTDESTGALMPNVSARVELEGGGLVSIYSDRAASTPYSNPQDFADGKVSFFVAGGAYKITLTSGLVSRVLRYKSNGLLQEKDSLHAADIAFTPAAGIGSNTVQAAIEELAAGSGGWLNVVSHGATGDGTTDDAPFIMDAVAVADTVEGGGLVFPAPSAHYQVSSAIALDGSHPVTFLGVGQPELRTDYAGSAISVGAGPATEQGFVSLKDFKLWGDVGSVTGIRAQFAVNLLLDGLSLYQIGTLGAYLSDCYSFLVDRCQFNECGNAGLYLTKASMNRGVISRSKFVNHGGANQCGISIVADGSMHHGGLITGCDFEFNTNGIRCADISGLHIADCYFEENDFHILAETTCDNIKISDCQFLGPGVVDLSDVDGVTLDNLVFYGTGAVLDLTGCTNVRLGRLYFPNGGTIAGLANYISISGPSSSVIDAMGDLGAKAQVRLRTMFTAPNGGGSIALYHNNASGALPSSGDRLGFLIGGSNDNGTDRNGAALVYYADGNWSSTSLPTRVALEVAPSGATARAAVLNAYGTGQRVTINGSLGTGVPVSKTADFTVADTENDVINNKASTCVVTLPAASAYPGRVLWCMNEVAQAMNSASSNVVPKVGGAAGTSILPATDGAWARLKSDGTNWKITASGT